MTTDDAATDPSTATPAQPADAMSWAEASAELRRIVTDLDDPELDIDLLAGKVERAAALVAVCRSRIERARDQINTVMLDLDDS